MKSSPPKLSLRTAKGLGNIILILFKNLQLKGMAETLGRILRKSPFFSLFKCVAFKCSIKWSRWMGITRS